MMAYNRSLTSCTTENSRAPRFLSTKLRYTVVAVLVASIGTGCSSLRTPQSGNVIGQDIEEIVVERYAGPNVSWHETEVPKLHSQSDNSSGVRYVGTLVSRWRPVKSAQDLDADGVLDVVDHCPDTTDFVTVDKHGCGLFDAVLDQVTFSSGSWLLNTRSRNQLDRLADALKLFPEARVEVRAHTDSSGAAKANLLLSAHRADTAFQYLLSQGVQASQMRAVGMGEDYPLVRNDTHTGRELNRRVEVVTLPDRDAASYILARNLSLHNMVIGKDDPEDNPRVQTQAEMQIHTIVAENRQKRRSDSRAQIASTDKQPSVSAPALYAALPYPSPASKKDGSEEFALKIAPLPRPGKAPGFSHTGVLQNVSFDSGSSSLLYPARVALLPLLRDLQEQPTVNIVVMAHTDDLGDAENNLLLSVKRAEAVVEHLVAQGIESNRLKAEGYGEALPLFQNVSDKNRERNRRIEVRVMSATP